jgi:hypothetical protein
MVCDDITNPALGELDDFIDELLNALVYEQWLTNERDAMCQPLAIGLSGQEARSTAIRDSTQTDNTKCLMTILSISTYTLNDITSSYDLSNYDAGLEDQCPNIAIVPTVGCDATTVALHSTVISLCADADEQLNYGSYLDIKKTSACDMQ